VTDDLRNPEDAPGPAIEATRARQAVTGHGARYVLFWGLLGAIVAFAIIMLA
jgi:hypothetical protein